MVASERLDRQRTLRDMMLETGCEVVRCWITTNTVLP